VSSSVEKRSHRSLPLHSLAFLTAILCLWIGSLSFFGRPPSAFPPKSTLRNKRKLKIRFPVAGGLRQRATIERQAGAAPPFFRETSVTKVKRFKAFDCQSRNHHYLRNVPRKLLHNCIVDAFVYAREFGRCQIAHGASFDCGSETINKLLYFYSYHSP